MKFRPSLVVFGLIATLALPAVSAAAGPELKIPDFSHLRLKATDSVDVTLDGFLLRIAKKFAKADSDDPDAEAIHFLQDVKSVRVRNFTFDSDDAYSQADVDSVRKQLTGPEWSPLVQVRRRNPQEDVDVYLCLDGEKIKGLAVIASEPREFTIVNIVGSIDIDKISQLEGEFHIPKYSQNQ